MADSVKQVVDMKEIREFAAKVARAFRPKKVILFGSYAYGRPEEASDVDILVIMPTPLRSVEQAIEIRRTVRSSFPLDLIVRTPEQIEERLSLGDFFIKEVLVKGRVLYEAAD